MGITQQQRKRIDDLMRSVNYLRSYVGLRPRENDFVFLQGADQIDALTTLERETEREVCAIYLPMREARPIDAILLCEA